MACQLAWKFFSFALMLICPVSNEYNDVALTNWTSAFKLEDGDQEVTVLEGVTRPLVCEIHGYQSDDLTFVWLSNSKKITQENSVTSKDGELTTSTLNFQGSRKDDRTEITCRIFADNSTNSVSNRSVNISVFYRPVVEIHYGHESSQVVFEGDDVTLHCSIASNPPPTSLSWYQDDKVFKETHNPGKVEDLNLHSLTNFNSGNYSCSGVNAVGSSTSQNIPVTVRFLPICVERVRTVQFLQKYQRLNVSCDVHAYPSPQTFSWESNINGSLNHRSATYEVFSVQHNTTLYCWAKNEVGEQKEKCTIRLVQATSPDPVTNCSFQMNNSSVSGLLDFMCQAGGDGGLQVNFTLIIQDYDNGDEILRETSASSPNFTIAGLKGDKQYNVTVRSSNSAGSERHTFIYNHVDPTTSFWKPQTVVTITLLLGVIFIIILGIVIYYCNCSKNQGSHRLADPVNGDEMEHFLENETQPVTVARNPLNGVAPRASVESFSTE